MLLFLFHARQLEVGDELEVAVVRGQQVFEAERLFEAVHAEVVDVILELVYEYLDESVETPVVVADDEPLVVFELHQAEQERHVVECDLHVLREWKVRSEEDGRKERTAFSGPVLRILLHQLVLVALSVLEDLEVARVGADCVEDALFSDDEEVSLVERFVEVRHGTGRLLMEFDGQHGVETHSQRLEAFVEYARDHEHDEGEVRRIQVQPLLDLETLRSQVLADEQQGVLFSRLVDPQQQLFDDERHLLRQTDDQQSESAERTRCGS